jgi:predicted Zn-dependent protease
LQLNRKPQPQITEAEVRGDGQYWKKFTDEALGSWLEEKTSLNEVCDFAYKYGLGRQLAGYKGDKEFAANSQARKSYSKLRSSIAGLYTWRAENAASPDERQRMFDAADYAYRQSYAICPGSPEATYRYVKMLLERNRSDDAALIVKTDLRLTPGNEQLRDLLAQVEKVQ